MRWDHPGEWDAQHTHSAGIAGSLPGRAAHRAGAPRGYTAQRDSITLGLARRFSRLWRGADQVSQRGRGPAAPPDQEG